NNSVLCCTAYVASWHIGDVPACPRSGPLSEVKRTHSGTPQYGRDPNQTGVSSDAGDRSSQTRYSANSLWLVRDQMQFHQSTRRELITFLAGAAVAWPFASQAQQQGRIPKVGVLWHAESAEGEGPLFTGLAEGFKKLGYVEGRNIALEHRFPNE